MRYESLPGLTLPKIGYGTWRIGNNRQDVARSLAALRSALETGYTHFDTAEMYGSGRAEELLGRAIREAGASREELFIATKVMPSHLRYEDVLKSCENSLRRLQMDFVDLYLIHWPEARMKLEGTFRAMNQLLRDGRVKHLGVSNFNVSLLKEAQRLSETSIITNQVSYSLSDRSYVKNGVLEYCQQNGILFTAYSPVNEGRLYSNRTFDTIAAAHHATIYQIALAWVISQPGIITIPMSFDPGHIKENFDAAQIELSESEIKQLSNL
jgi:diketogulonate reductase-like aldo/keto reductase